MNPPRVVRFGTFELDRASGALSRQGQRVALQDQPAQLLALLVSRPGEVVTRDELRRALWSEDTFVDFDTALNVAVNKVRQALGDSASSPRFVETVPKRGYRFLADVHPVGTAAAPPEPAAEALERSSRSVRNRFVLVALVTGLAALVVSSTVHVDRARRKVPAGPAGPVQPTNAAAYDRYQRARHLIDRRTIEDSQRAVTLLDEAAALDPASAAVQAGIADASLAITLLGAPYEPHVPRAQQAAARALELDPGSAEALALRGTLATQFGGDMAAGARDLERALALGPRSPLVLRLSSLFLWQEGRFDEALAVNERELALDPASAFANRNRAIILYYARRYDEAVAQCQKTLELDRYFITAYNWLGRAYEQLGRDRDAVDAYLAPLTFEEASAPELAALRDAFARGGLRGYWRAWLRMEHVNERTDQGALAALRVGDSERALAEIEKLVAQRSPWVRTLGFEPLWDPVRIDPRFQLLLRRARSSGAP